MGSNTFKEGELLQWEELAKMDNKEEVLVNSNRLLWQLSRVEKLKNRENVVGFLDHLLSSEEEPKRMYIPLKVGMIKKCFAEDCDKLPVNSFKRLKEVRLNIPVQQREAMKKAL